MGKSFDTFAPIGPCITTADEIEDPNYLQVQFWNNGDLRHDYVTDDMEHRVPELVEFATGDHDHELAATSSPAAPTTKALGRCRTARFCEIEIEKIGRMTFNVTTR